MNYKIRCILISLVLVCVHISFSAFANSNDDFANAITISNIHDYCSSNAQFDNLTATADGTRPSGWQSGPKNNVWFKFQATTPGITIELKSGGVYGTLNSPQLALYTAAQAELNSNNVYNKEWISLSYDQLTVGDWYYINVDVNDPYNTNKKGTFTLCLNDEVSNDFKAGATELTNLNNWSSGNAALTNVHGTPDGTRPAGWGDGPKYNVWYKFQATTSAISIDIKSGNEFGTMYSPQLALYDASDNLIDSKENYYGSELSMNNDQLTPGAWYFICIDVDDKYNTNRKQGTFTLYVSDSVNNDLRTGAIELTDLNNWCSANAAFTNAYGTPDGARPSGWQSGPKNNVWFKFQATTQEVTVEVKSGGNYGTLNSPQLALYDDAQNELNSNNVYNKEWLSLSYNQLTVGSWYYINVDVNDPYNTNMRGSFTLCINDKASNDFKEGAIELIDLNNWCSGNAAFRNDHGTPDGARPSGWGDGPKYNVWFKFQATTETVSIDLNSGNEFGTLKSPQMALYDASDNELKSKENYNGNSLSITQNQLTLGDWYYLSVDVDDKYNTRTKQGTFTLCINGISVPETNTLEVMSLGTDSLKLAWTDTSSVFMTYEILRKESSDPDFSVIATITNGTKEYYDVNVVTDTEYLYKIRYTDNGNPVGETPEVVGTPYWQGNVPDYLEYRALKALYDYTDGDNWYRKSDWLNGKTYTEMDAWEGVTITNGDIRVLQLSFNNLKGNIPPEIGLLKSMEYLVLGHNKIKSIPDEIGDLSGIVQIDLGFNEIEVIPDGVSRFDSIDRLALNDNKITQLPFAMHYMWNKNVELQNNYLTLSVLINWFGGPNAYRTEGNPDLLWTYAPQRALTTDTIQFGVIRDGYDVLKTSTPNYLNTNRYQWQKYDGSEWQDRNIGDECHIYGQEYGLGLYRYKITNIWAIDLTVYSPIYNVQYSYDLVPDSVEFAALEAFYNSTNGPNWNNNTNWLSGSTIEDMENWYGIKTRDGDVYELYIRYNNLDGHIPPEFCQLDYLNYVSLEGNKIKSIPDEIGDMFNLQYFYMPYNELEELPAGIGNLRYGYLQLEFDYNKLTTLPYSLRNLEEVYLRVGNNYLEFVDLEPFFIAPNTPVNGVYDYMPQRTFFPDSIENTFSGTDNIRLDAQISHYYAVYQWQKYNGTTWDDITNETNNELILNNAESSYGMYRCEVTSPSGYTNLILHSSVYNIIKLDSIVNNYDKVLYVSMDGIDSTAVVNDLSNAWALPHVASVQAHTLAQSDGLNYLVYVRKGTYEDYWVTMPGVDIYFEEDAVVWYNTDNTASRSIISDWRGGAGDYTILGKGRFYVTTENGGDDRDAVNFRYNSKLTLQGKEFGSLNFWSQFNDAFTIDSAVFRTTQFWNNGQGITYNNCTFLLGFQDHTPYGQSLTHEVFNNCTFILQDVSNESTATTATDHNGDFLFVITCIHGARPGFDATNLTNQQVADSMQGFESKACFEIEHGINGTWHQEMYLFQYTFNNPTFILDKPNCIAVRIIWNDMLSNIDYTYDGITINGGTAILGPYGSSPVFLQADKRDQTAADIPIYINGTTYDGFTERVFATDYFPMGVNLAGKEYQAIQSGTWNNPDTWAVGGVSDGTIPAPNSNVIIDGYAVTVSDVQECGIINLNNDQTGTSLIIDNGDLTVNGNITISNANSTNTGAALRVVNGGKIEIKETQNP